MNLEEIEKDVKSILSEKRFYHSKCVMDVCEELAILYGVDIEAAKKVGIAHDIAKEMPEEEKLIYIKENSIQIDEIEKEYTGLLHAKIGADIAKKKYGYTEEMAKAIEAHTTGKEDMDMLAKILYMADWTGIDRNEFEDIEYIRELSKTNIDEAIVYTLGQIVEEKIEKNEQIHIDTILTRNKLLSKE